MSTSTRRLGRLLDNYLRKRLSRDIHPAITLVRDRGEATSTFLLPPDDNPQATSSKALVGRPQGEDDDDKFEIDLDEIYRDAKCEKQGFQLAMEAYESTTVGSKFKTDVTENPIHTWDDVLTEVQRAQDMYSDASGMWGRIQKGLRRFGSNGQALEAWASLLPSESEYTSVLCGGLKLIFGAAARLHDLRSDIGDALAEIPEQLRTTHLAMGIFKRSKELHQTSAALYTAIIAALHHIVVWYKEKAIKTLFKSIFKQESYAKHLDELLQDIRKQSERFREAVSLCSYERIMDTSLMVKTQGIQQAENHKVVVGYLDKSIRELQGFKGDFQAMAGDLQGEMKEMRAQFAEMLTDILAAFLSSDSRMDPGTQDLKDPNLPIRRAKSESKLIRDIPGAQDELLSAFDYNTSLAQDDIAASLRSVWQIPRPDQDRLVAAMQSPKLQCWITQTVSSALFLHFNAPRNQRSTSFIAAKLADSIRSSSSSAGNVIVLCFFCGSYSRPVVPGEDADFDVASMMRSLTSQLLIAYPDFSIHIVRRIREADLNSVGDLGKLFHLLLRQLPRHKTVFCILDGVTRFEENKALREESELAVRELMEIVSWTAEHENGGCCFKLLLTSPGSSRVLYRHLVDPEKDSVRLPAKIPSQGGYTRGKWEGSINRLGFFQY
ncbi:hypothetical protein B0H63DRAFT_489796 [Podospora didyma]|uniref:Fungal STAND N-terminal Goodbye domain-containing protein n=1 Tax=Podospora didyma TaxID=330526 RepID=A0AAE0K1P4_9PEZI|nr:hypothetical protein B0H63DRAFT_489796 [Podospora didyma]